MTQCNGTQRDVIGRGRGTGGSQFSNRTENKSEGKRIRDLIPRRPENGGSPVPRPFPGDPTDPASGQGVKHV